MKYQNLLLTAALLTVMATATHAGSPVAPACAQGQTAYKALKLTVTPLGTRVDYLNLATSQKNWTNMEPHNLQSMGVKLGAMFCMRQEAAIS